jgi:chromate reductase
VHVVGISGSARRNSYNTLLLGCAERLLPVGVSFETWADLKSVPAFDEDDRHQRVPEAVAGLRSTLAGADAVLFATPEYNSSVPGALKNALDWISRPLEESPLRNTPVAVVGASTGAFGAAWGQADLRKVLARIGARVLDGELLVGGADRQFDRAGRLVDPELESELAGLVERLVETARARSESGRLPASVARN